ncbi:MAG: hypothetical protein AMS27_03940 [Bacteroides sp. SM23_62_1]|nr:MAG: hypothetical protein AMS27_03940 [Bacteroides sp. SM23_62_1]
MKKIYQISILVIYLFSPVYAQDDYVYPLQLSPGNRYLTDQKGTPFFWSGEAAWSLIAQLNRADVKYYLDNRGEKGFNVIMVNLIEHKFCTNAPNNYYNEPPFTGKPFITPNGKYFNHVDYVIESAASRGIIVLLCPLYLGYNCGDEGWCHEVQEASLEDLRYWGRYIGERYKKYDNIIWCIGGDTDPTIVKDKVLECVKGIFEKDNRHLFTAHNQPESYADSPWKGEKWLSVNNVYSYSTILYQQCKIACEQVPVQPFFMMESAYENEHEASGQRLRSEAYWPVLSGAMGHIFGNCPIWHFGAQANWCNRTDWKAELDNTGSDSMEFLQRLFISRPWYLLIPDFNHQVLLEGYGTWGEEDYVTTARTIDGSTVIAYLPTSRQITIDMTKISGEKAKCTWYNPSAGEFLEIGIFETKDMQTFIPPADGDWVIVIDKI